MSSSVRDASMKDVFVCSQPEVMIIIITYRHTGVLAAGAKALPGQKKIKQEKVGSSSW
jgi:hypothetical protein